MEIKLFSHSALFHIKTLSVPKFEIATCSVEFLLIVFSYIVHAIPEKFKKRGEGGREERGLRTCKFQGVGILKKRKSMRKFLGSVKKEVEFSEVIKRSRKNHVEFPWVLAFCLVEISKPKKEYTTILQNFLR